MRRGTPESTCRDTLPQDFIQRHEEGNEEGAQKKDILEMYYDSHIRGIVVFVVVIVVIVVKRKREVTIGLPFFDL
jgi:hypothetical protein